MGWLVLNFLTCLLWVCGLNPINLPGLMVCSLVYLVFTFFFLSPLYFLLRCLVICWPNCCLKAQSWCSPWVDCLIPWWVDCRFAVLFSVCGLPSPSPLVQCLLRRPSHPYFLARPNAPAAIWPSIENTYGLSNPLPSKPSIVFLTSKTILQSA